MLARMRIHSLIFVLDFFVLFRIFGANSHSISYTKAYLNISYITTKGGQLYAGGIGRFGSSGPYRTAEGILISVPGQDWCHSFPLKAGKRRWIALIPRGNCSFKRKIQTAKSKNASAVIIYNRANSADDFVMLTDSRVNMVSVSISYSLGSTLAVLKKTGSYVYVKITVESIHRENRISFSQLMTVGFPLASVLIFISSLALFHKHRTRRKRQKEIKTKLSRLTTKVYCEEDEDDTCAICLDNYRHGQTLRILLCKHTFHKRCIDPWILERETCPVCKQSTIKLTSESDETTSSTSTDSANENRNCEGGPRLVQSV